MLDFGGVRFDGWHTIFRGGLPIFDWKSQVHIMKVGLSLQDKIECFSQLLQDFVAGPNIRLVEDILHQLRLVVYPISYRVFYVPANAGFLPSAVFVVICNVSMSRVMRNFLIKD